MENSFQQYKHSEPLDMNLCRENFKTNGFTRIAGFFSQEEMDELIDDIKVTGPKSSGPSGLSRGELMFFSNLFLGSDRIRDFITQQRLIDFVKEIIGPDFWVRWDQAVYKGKGAPVFPWHQDNAYNDLPNEHFQLWIALSDMNSERGGLWLIPGSHVNGRLPHSKIGNHQVYSGPTDNAVCIEAKKGDLVLFSSFMLHYTSPNETDHDRWAYVVEYMSLKDQDPHIAKPFFVAARNGRSQPEFVPYTDGRAKYFAAIAKAKWGQFSSRVGRRVGHIKKRSSFTSQS